MSSTSAASNGENAVRYIVVTGGVVSGLGKGITISSIARMLQASGFAVTSIKIDPYLNTDAGTMSPFEHGEVFVLDDGGETDLDLGNYERFLDIALTRDHNITTGKVYQSVLDKERRGDYLGKTVQVVPHVTEEIQNRIERVAKIPVDGSGRKPDFCLVEVGGTVGDIESMVFLEAIRQFQFRVGIEHFCLVHVSLVPVMGSVGEQKTKPTQHGVKELRSLGLSPDVIVCRAAERLLTSTQNKISVFCHVHPSHVLSVHDCSNIYHVPLLLREQGLPGILGRHFGVDMPTPNLDTWGAMAHRLDGFTERVNIVLVGKYTGLQDSYLSVIKSLKHASMACDVDLQLVWVEASNLEDSAKDTEEGKDAWAKLQSADGVVVPGGFGHRGVEGKIAAAGYCRRAKKPFLGICLGFQVAVIEFARSECGWDKADSAEFDEHGECPVIVFMPEINPDVMGGTMRLGARDTVLDADPFADADKGPGLARALYGFADRVSERHRHRYEVNPEKVADIEAKGLKFSGRDDTGQRMEVAELPRDVHPFFLGVQYHPEFKSRPIRPSPPFHGLIMAATGKIDAFLAQPKAKRAKANGEGTVTWA